MEATDMNTLDMQETMGPTMAFDPVLDPSVYLGPARIRQVAGNRAELEFPDERVWAVFAVTPAYQAVAGDTVLALGQGGDWYVIGVIEGKGQSSIAVPGDLKISAPHGKIDLLSGRGIRIKSPVVRLAADRMEFAARRLVEHLTDATRRVKNACRVRAGRMRHEVEQDYRVDARNVTAHATEDVRLNGGKVKLG